jgi:hypothetical protein
MLLLFLDWVEDASNDAMLGGWGLGEIVWPDESVLSDPLVARCASVRAGGRSASASVSLGSGDIGTDMCSGGVMEGDGGVDCDEAWRGEWLCECANEWW